MKAKNTIQKKGRAGRRMLSMLLAAVLVFANIDLSLTAKAAEPGSIEKQGEGSQQELSSKEDLEKLRDGDSEGKYFILTKDIDLEGTAENPWTPIPDFKGILDGAGHTIEGLYIDWGKSESKNSDQGLFRSNSGTIKDLTVEGSITTEFNAGGIAGVNHKQGIITGCISRVNITAVDAVGGIAGCNQGLIQECRNYGKLIGMKDTGPTMSGSTLPRGMGGIAGNTGGYYLSPGTVIDCINDGEIYRDEQGTNRSSNGEYYGGVGGIVGVHENYDKGSLTGNINNALVTGYKWVGGITGLSNGPVENNTNNGSVTGLGGGPTGGITGMHCFPGGSLSRLLSGNNNNGNVKGTGENWNSDSDFGGVIGEAYSVGNPKGMVFYKDNFFLKTEDCNSSLNAIGNPSAKYFSWMNEWNDASESSYKLPNPGEPFRGEGTMEAPYIIFGIEDLESLREAVNKEDKYSTAHFKIVQDIDLKGNDQNPWMPIGTTEHPFKGTLNGDGHTVSGLYINDGTKDNQGLLGVNAGTIENLRVEGTITGHDNVGGIAGTNTKDGVITGCVTDVAVTGNNYIGGIVGKNEGKIENCTSYGSITGNDYVGGIAGNNEASGIITGGVNNGNVSLKEGSTGTHIGGITGENKNGNSNSVTGSYVQNENTNKGISGIGGKTNEESGIKTGANPLPEAGEVFPGKGTATKPYQVYAQEDLEKLQDEIEKDPDRYKDVHFELMKDITLQGGSTQTPIGTEEKPFQGIFDGNGHTIKGLNVEGSGSDNQGLFGVNAGTIQNLIVEGSVTGENNVGGIVGTNKPSGIIRDCIVNANVQGETNVGGIVGKNEGIIKDSVANTDVDGKDNVGGIAGNNEGDIVRCATKTENGPGGAVTGNVTGTGTNTGGITGNNNGIIKDSTNNAEVTGGSANTGGVTGDNGTNGTVNNGGNNGNVTTNVPGGKDTVGALVGKNENTAEGSVSGSYKQDQDTNEGLKGIGNSEKDPAGVTAVTEDVKNPQKPFKGSGTEEDPFQIATEDDLKKLADLVNSGEKHEGEHFKIISDGITLTDENKPWTPIGTVEHPFKGNFDGGHKTVSGLTTAEGKDNQGLFGVNDGTIENLTVEGSVTGKDKAGGIAGSNTENGIIKNCTSDVAVNGESNVGGIAGENRGEIANCINKGTVNGTDSNTGGITGHNGETGRVKDNINSGNVTGPESGGTTGAVIGKNDNKNGIGTDVGGNYYKKTDDVNKNLYGTGGSIWDSEQGNTSGPNAMPGEPFEGSGTSQDPYIISSKEDLENLRDNVIGGNTYENIDFKVTADISLGGEGSPWTPIGTEKYPFMGTIDGDDKTVSGLYINDREKDNQGLFGVNAGTIKNLILEGSVTGKGNVGGIAGQNNGRIVGCTNKGSVTGKDCVGGITGTNRADGIVVQNVNSGNVTGENKQTVGAIIGKNENTTEGGIYGNYYQKTDTINKDLTGIGGMETDPEGITSGTGPIPEKYFTQQSGTENDPYIIAFKGDLEALRDSVNKGNTYKDKYFKITKDISLGGEYDPWTPIGTGKYPFEGTISGEGHTISSLYIDDQAGDDQGLFGVNAGTIENLFVEGSVTGKNNVGGIAGTNTKDGIIKDCTANVTVKGQDNVGGIAGKNEGTITGCTNKGNVTGKDNVGGITGTNGENGKVKDNVNNGFVFGENKQTTGAIIGKNDNTNLVDDITGNYYQKTDEFNENITGIGGMETDPAGITSGSSPTPGEETPGGDNPGGNNPGGNTPGGNNPGGNNPGGNTPGGNNPGGNNPGGNTPGGNTPGGTTPGDVLSGLTPEQKEEVNKIAKELNVPVETAKKLQAMAQELGIDMDVLLLTDRDIVNQDSEGDVKGSSFSKLQVKAAKAKKNSITIKWNKVKGASGYQIYTAKCGKKNKYKLVKTIKKAGTTSFTYKKLKKGTAYKIIVKAYRDLDGKKYTVAASKTVHEVTMGGKKTNAKTVKVNKTKVKIKKGKKFKIKSKIVKVSSKKKLPNHRKVSYESTNKKIATVSKKGVIKGKKKGTCYVYVYVENGISKKVKVTVR